MVLENLLSQLDTTGRDIDQTGNSNILLASYIFQGKNGYKPGESNFSYKMVPGPNGNGGPSFLHNIGVLGLAQLLLTIGDHEWPKPCHL